MRTYWAEVGDIVKRGGYTAFNLSVDGKGGLTYGDQDILNILSFRHPEWFRELPQKVRGSGDYTTTTHPFPIFHGFQRLVRLPPHAAHAV